MEHFAVRIRSLLKSLKRLVRRGLLSPLRAWVSLALATTGALLIIIGMSSGCASTNPARALYPEAVALAGSTTTCIVSHVNLDEDLTSSYLAQVAQVCGAQTYAIMSTELRDVMKECSQKVEDCVVSNLQSYFAEHRNSGSTTELYSIIVDECIPINLSDVTRWCRE
jgi:hypothetical protein